MRATRVRSFVRVMAAALALAAGLGGVPSVADADPRKKSAQAKTPEQEKREEEAYALFEESETRYREGNFAEAAELLRAAYALDPEPTLLFNLGRALEGAGDLEGAVKAYQSYVAADPEAENRLQTERRIETLEKQLAEKKELERARAEEAKRRAELERLAKGAAGANGADPSATTKVDRGGPGALPWITLGLGAGALATGGALGILASAAREDAVRDPIHLTASGSADDARSLATGANIAYAVGAGLAIGGLTWLLLSTSDDAPATTALSIGPTSLTFTTAF
ncbi:tetratricopeptide repeat protein [Myxococcota bacterium]|nr:tetratricopeptide repeat protein [Myxococcota bacterium]